MKHLLRALAFATVAVASPASAALSGFYDSGEQIGVILASAEVADALASAEVADALGQAPLLSIENTGTREDGAAAWVVRARDCELTVYLVPVPPQGPGMTTYDLDQIGTCE